MEQSSYANTITSSSGSPLLVGRQLSFALYLYPLVDGDGIAWVCLVTARLICLQLKGGSPVFSSPVTTIHTCAGLGQPD